MSDGANELLPLLHAPRGSGELSRLRSGLVVFDRYEIRSVLGAGAMGTVYLAQRFADRAPVAIKVEHFDESGHWRGRLEREAHSLRSVSHRHVARVFEHGVLADGRVAVVFEFIDGESLHNALRARGGSLPWRRVVQSAAQVLEGLAAVHDASLLHRDIKPSNVLLANDPDSRAVLIDFGFCKNAGLPSITLEFDVVGTPEFMAPERCNDAPYDARSDLYSVGVLLFYALSGELPFGAAGIQSVLSKSAGVEAGPLRCPQGREPWPAALDAAVAKALRFDPEQRFATASAFAERLRALLS